MALGRNIKKKTLIPSEKKEIRKQKSSEKPSPTRRSTTGKKREEVATENPYLTRQEFERRQALHQKFREDISALKEQQVHFIVFTAGGENFAVEIDKVSEVVATPTVTRLPQAPAYVPGMATIRGKGVVLLDLALKLGLTDASGAQSERGRYTMVISTARFTVGVLVPEVPVSKIIAGDTIQAATDSISETSVNETYIKGLIKTPGRMIFFLDIEELIEGDRMQARVAKQ